MMNKRRFIELSAITCMAAMIVGVNINKEEYTTIKLENQLETLNLAESTKNILSIREKAVKENELKLEAIELRSTQLAKSIVADVVDKQTTISRHEVPMVASTYIKTEPGHMETINPEALEEELNIESVSSVETTGSVDTGNYEYVGNFKLTSYCGCRKCNGKWTGYNGKYGLPLVNGRTVAVDESVIPLGTWLEIYIEGQGWQRFRAEDTGSGVRGKHIDVYVGENHADCYNRAYNTKGKHTAQVRIVK